MKMTDSEKEDLDKRVLVMLKKNCKEDEEDDMENFDNDEKDDNNNIVFTDCSFFEEV